ncbi:unnamed protein product [Cuscuta europaea]|uniref:Zinc knuckle CX2CX4HX4C domain-containing protein n=1 Tax=Cuscuta europaea TaxID=41803 RepID=A0A9P0YQ75_CUSEU|nr:unnamed protein product [Cuscuta europaea]
MKRVLENGPWLFEQKLLVLHEIKSGDIPLRVPLTMTEFWVQIHNVSYDFMTLEAAQRIGNYLGKFVKIDDNQLEGRCNAYLRNRITLDIGRPLKKGTKLRKGSREFWVDFKYEKLSRFCFVCRLIRHTDRYSPMAYEQRTKELVKHFGPELRARGGEFTQLWATSGWCRKGMGLQVRTGQTWEMRGQRDSKAREKGLMLLGMGVEGIQRLSCY